MNRARLFLNTTLAATIIVVFLPSIALAQSPFDRNLPTDPPSVYKNLCSFCHDDGTIGAPILGDLDAWLKRREKGRIALQESVLEGAGHMEARRNRRGYSDDHIRSAVDYLLRFSR